MAASVPPVALTVHCGSPVLPTTAPPPLPLLLRLSAASAPAGTERPRLSAIVCVDVSGSMKGEPLREVQHAVGRMAELLGDDDQLGVVAFHSEAWAVSPLRTLGAGASPPGRQALRREVDQLRADGKTNIDSALARAALLLPAPAPGAQGVTTRQGVLLLSDGQPNVGQCRPEDLAASAALVHQRGVNVSTLGFGKEHNEDVLLAVAQGGGGRYAYVKDPQAADSAFARALATFFDLAARQVRLTLRPGEGVEILRVLGNPRVTVTAEGLQLSLPDLLYGETLDVLVELGVAAVDVAGPQALLRATLSACASPPGDGAAATVSVAATALRAPGAAVTLADEVDRAQAQARLAMYRDDARQRADRRDYAGAAACLRAALQRVEQVPSFRRGEDTPLGDAYEAIQDDLLVIEAKAPDRDEKYREYRKIQLDNQSVHGSLRGGSVAYTSPSLRRMTHLVAQMAGARGRLVLVQGAAFAGGTAPQAPSQPLREFPVRGEVRIGRGRTNDLVLDEHQASRVHAVLLPGGREGGFLLEDMGSSNGTQVNGSHIYRGTRLKHGDLIQIGRTVLRYLQDA